MRLALTIRQAVLLGAIACLGCCTEKTSSSIGDAGGAGAAGGGAGGTGGALAAGGSGGAGGGGKGGTGGSGDGGSEPIIVDEIWSSVPGSEVWWDICRALQTHAAAIREQVLTWEPCGPGCERATLDLGFDNFPGSPSIDLADGAVLSGAILTVSTARSKGGPYELYRSSIRLDDGMLMAMVRVDILQLGEASCNVFQRLGRVTAIAVTDDHGTSRMVTGFVDPVTGTHAWFPPWTRSLVCKPLPVEAPDGPRLFFSCGAAGYLAPAGGPAETQIVSGDAEVITGSASSYRDSAAWSERGEGGTSRIRAWTAAAGTRTLIDALPGITCGVSISADRIVGWQVPANGGCDDLGPGLQLWHAPLRSDGSVGAVEHVAIPGRVLPITKYSSRNGFAAFQGVVGGDNGTFSDADLVVRLSDGAARRIVPQPGYQVHDRTMAVTDHHVYWAEGERIKYDGRVSVVYRHALTHFDTLGLPFGTQAD